MTCVLHDTLFCNVVCWFFKLLNSLFCMLSFPQVIPSLLGQPMDRDAKPQNLFAYISVENIKVKDNKPVRGQILKCNLTKSRLAAGVILAEVQFTKILFIIPNAFIVAYLETNIYSLDYCVLYVLLYMFKFKAIGLGSIETNMIGLGGYEIN